MRYKQYHMRYEANQLWIMYMYIYLSVYINGWIFIIQLDHGRPEGGAKAPRLYKPFFF